MKVAVLFNGNSRTIDKCKTNILRTFSPLNPDYYASTYNNVYGYHRCVQDSFRFYDDPILSKEDILKRYDGFNLKDAIVDDINEIKEIYSREQHLLNINMRHPSSFLQYRKLSAGIKMILEKTEKYDVIIKIRSDLWFKAPFVLDPTSINKEIIVSTGNVYPNDCVVGGTPLNMSNIMEFIVKEFYDCSNPLSATSLPHGVLQSSIEHYNLKITQQPLLSHVVRANANQYY
jgi:hypothetical protein